MKREAVQEERQRAARGAEDAHPSSSVQVLMSDPFLFIQQFDYLKTKLAVIFGPLELATCIL